MTSDCERPIGKKCFSRDWGKDSLNNTVDAKNSLKFFHEWGECIKLLIKKKRPHGGFKNLLEGEEL